jgi:hypothetical protein
VQQLNCWGVDVCASSVVVFLDKSGCSAFRLQRAEALVQVVRAWPAKVVRGAGTKAASPAALAVVAATERRRWYNTALGDFVDCARNMQVVFYSLSTFLI